MTSGSAEAPLKIRTARAQGSAGDAELPSGVALRRSRGRRALQRLRARALHEVARRVTAADSLRRTADHRLRLALRRWASARQRDEDRRARPTGLGEQMSEIMVSLEQTLKTNRKHMEPGTAAVA